MTHRENFMRALKRQQPESVPYGFTLCDSLEAQWKRKTGLNDYFQYYQFPYRYVGLLPTKLQNDYSRYHAGLPENAVTDEWGVAHIRGELAHFSRMDHPMKNFTCARQVLDFPLPDVLADYRWAQMGQDVQALHDSGLAAIYSAVQIFEPAWYLRGLENLLCDMLDDGDMAAACLNRMAGIQTAVSERAAAAGADMIVFGDDVGTQKGMMMRPDIWRKWLKPGMRAAIGAAKQANPAVIAFYHSDGVVYDIIPDLIEIGVDVLNPVQPECMDPALVKKLYGERLSFWGTIGTQTTMPFGTPHEIAQTVRLRIETAGDGGGLVLAPSHLLEPEVPWENIEAFVEAAIQYGRY